VCFRHRLLKYRPSNACFHPWAHPARIRASIGTTPAMVAFAKAHRKPHTPDRSAKDSGHRYYSAEISRWLSRDPVGEEGGLNVYGALLNAPLSYVDPFGLKCRVVFLVGHGYTDVVRPANNNSLPELPTDAPRPWVFQQALAWYQRLDTCDRIGPFACGVGYLPRYVLYHVQSPSYSRQEMLDLATNIRTITGGERLDSWGSIFGRTAAEQRDTMRRWDALVWSLRRDVEEKLCKTCCCREVMWTYYCQEGDRDVDGLVDLILARRQGMWTGGRLGGPWSFVNGLPRNESFCGKTFRYSCGGRYLNYEGALTETQIQAWLP